MTQMDEFGRLRTVFLVISLRFSFPGASCDLVVSPVGPIRVNVRAGSNATLPVLFGGAPDPTVTWYRGDLPVLTWTIGSGEPADVASGDSEVLKIESSGSLTFVNVPLDYTSNYTIEMTKSGLGKAVTGFTLTVFDDILNVRMNMAPESVKEGSDRFTLLYSMSQGVVEQQTWFFNGMEIKSSSHYTVGQRSLVVLEPNRSDTGRYTVLLTNPFHRVETHTDVSVLYGPDEPILEARPPQPFYVSGASLTLVCRAEGFPQPTAEWSFGGRNLSDSVLKLTNVQTSHGGVYTCKLINEQTKEWREKSMNLYVYETPRGNPVCSVQAVNANAELQYRCEWPGGTPQARLSFPTLSDNSSGAENYSISVAASETHNGKLIACVALHPLKESNCEVTASSPGKFLPAVRTSVASDGKIVVSVLCVSEASPEALVSWSTGSQALTNGTTHHISGDTTQLTVSGHNVSSFLVQKYTCTCRNPLGSQRRDIQLQGPSISDSSLFPNQDGTIVTLTWEVPATSIVTGFDIQMKGPDLLSERRDTRGSADKYGSIQQKPGWARSTDVFGLWPNGTYRFRVIPKARTIEGEPSVVHRIGPGEGLSGSAIAGIAAGIPCSILALVLLGGLIYLCFYHFNKNTVRHTRYPVPRAVEKAITTQSDQIPHNLLTGGLKSPPDYNRLQLTPSERSVALPTFVPPPPVRVATTV